MPRASPLREANSPRPTSASGSPFSPRSAKIGTATSRSSSAYRSCTARTISSLSTARVRLAGAPLSSIFGKPSFARASWP
jgi:hypothetical protein